MNTSRKSKTLFLRFFLRALLRMFEVIGNRNTIQISLCKIENTLAGKKLWEHTEGKWNQESILGPK